MKKGQGAFEYIMVVGIAMILIVPGAVLFFNYSKRSADETLRAQIDMVGKDIVEGVEKVYYIGENSWETVKVDVPDNVNWIYVLDDYELVIVYDTQVGLSEAVFYSDIPMTTPYLPIDGKYYINDITDPTVKSHAGLRIIRITSRGTFVVINETT